MPEEPCITIPALEEVYLSPGELAGATDIPIRDEAGGLLRDELGLPICEG